MQEKHRPEPYSSEDVFCCDLSSVSISHPTADLRLRPAWIARVNLQRAEGEKAVAMFKTAAGGP